MNLVHVELREANEFIRRYHRHHKPVAGYRFGLGCVHTGQLVGVVVVGRPVGGSNPEDWLEVTRCCSDGGRNICSFLYGAAARAGRALGFERIQTYILESELGSSLRASGWEFERLSHPIGWERRGRDVAEHLTERKQLWFKVLQGHTDYEHIQPTEPDLIEMEF
jgi:hypothetical protein